ncbi:MAG: PAS domain S-box protein [Methylovulum sp.]|nr:PAS domain S-box protein [Methylovulum sp.]
MHNKHHDLKNEELADTGHRWQMQALLNINEAKLHAIFNNVLDGIIIIDKHGIIKSLNPSAEKIFGYPPEELIGQSINRLMPEPDRSRHDSYIAEYLAGGNAKIIGVGREVYGLRKDGPVFPMALGVSEVNVEGCHLFIGTVHDISQYKQAEDALRKLSRHLELAREEERALIARVIHDELGGFLAGFKMDLGWLSKQLSADLPKYHEKAAVMTQHVDNAIKALRKIMTDLHPDFLDHFGLLAAIDWHVEKFRQQTGMECLLTAPEDTVEIDKKRSTAIFRIIQEALNNIVLHAMATKMSIDISVVDDVFLMRIMDNGCGMTPAQMDKAGSYGIKGMIERARFFEGEFTLEGLPGQGVLLNLRMPLQPSENGGHHD